MVNYYMHKPFGILAEYVRFFWSLEAKVNGAEPFTHRALPDNCIELIFYCKGKLSISSADGEEGSTFASGVFGQAQKFRQFKTHEDFKLFGVYLYPFSFTTLFNLPAHQLHNEKIDSETIWGREGRILEEQISLALNDKIRVQLVSNFLLNKIRKKVDYQQGFVQHVKSVIESNCVLSIPTFADECNLSRRQFERKFKEFSGLSPKDFFGIVRFKNALKEIEGGYKQLAQIAIETGYFDQSHFTNEFKKYSGYSPREYAMNHQAEVDMRATRDFKS